MEGDPTRLCNKLGTIASPTGSRNTFPKQSKRLVLTTKIANRFYVTFLLQGTAASLRPPKKLIWLKQLLDQSRPQAA